MSKRLCPSTSNSACAESDEQGPADASESEAPPDTDAVAMALEVEQCVEQQNVRRTSSARCIRLAVAIRSRRR